MSKLEEPIEIVTINIVFDVSSVTLKIPRMLFVNYWNKICDIENSIKMKRFRGYGGLTDEKLVKKQVERLGELQYDSHERIFRSVRLEHSSDDSTVLEYFLNYAIVKWTEEMYAARKEPKEITVTEIFKATTDPKVDVIKTRNTVQTDRSES